MRFAGARGPLTLCCDVLGSRAVSTSRLPSKVRRVIASLRMCHRSGYPHRADSAVRVPTGTFTGNGLTRIAQLPIDVCGGGSRRTNNLPAQHSPYALQKPGYLQGFHEVHIGPDHSNVIGHREEPGRPRPGNGCMAVLADATWSSLALRVWMWPSLALRVRMWSSLASLSQSASCRPRHPDNDV